MLERITEKLQNSLLRKSGNFLLLVRSSGISCKSVETLSGCPSCLQVFILCNMHSKFTTGSSVELRSLWLVLRSSGQKIQVILPRRHKWLSKRDSINMVLFCFVFFFPLKYKGFSDWFKRTSLKLIKKMAETYPSFKTLGEQCVCGV